MTKHVDVRESPTSGGAEAAEQVTAADTADESGVPPDATKSVGRNGWWRSARTRATCAGALIAVLAALVGVFAFLYSDADEAKSSMEDAAAQHAAAGKVAADYTTRSLTYSYQNTDAFFTAVKQDAGDALVKRYDDVRPTLTQIMQQAQVQASGRVLGTSVSGADGKYTVLVFASQKTQNVQNPQPSELPTLLKVVVSNTGRGWQIEDYGPAQ